ncbi:MAG: ADP-ribosylation factor-like protein 8A-like [Promethearchaeota archaeon CR_4]|nr:MAG: ADP-ribosylation factor-like protein 8A-like [Candidatus Lokiarchaeota archaeon CR_4]
MLRQVFIYRGSQRLYAAQYGKSIEEPAFNELFKKIYKESIKEKKDAHEVGHYDHYKYRLSFAIVPSKNLFFIFITDLSDSDKAIKKQLAVLTGEFLNVFGGVLDQELEESDLDILTPVVERIHKELTPKISLVGFSGVGKTTITALIRAQEIPMEHVPTITGDVGTIQIGKLTFSLWDFAGQEQFSFLWNKFVKGSDAVLIITDSSLENVDKSRFFIELVKHEAPYAHVAVIGNKQDLPGALPIPEIERLMNKVHAYSMVAVDPGNREKMINIIADILEISPEVSPLLKPLIERDKKVEAMETAIKNDDFRTACTLCKEISDICLQMGDDALSQDFDGKCQKLRAMVEKMEPEPVSPLIIAPNISQPRIAPHAVSQPEINASTISQPEITAPTNTQPPISPPAMTPPTSPQAIDTNLPPEERKKQIETTILNLQINKANIDKFLLDYEMQVLLGNVTEAEFQEKKKKSAQMKDNIEKQVAEYRNLLKSVA